MLNIVPLQLPQLMQSSFARFLISGGLNTALTYALYLLLLLVIPYQWAYTTVYLLGIALAFALNRTYVFKSHRGWFSLAMFPLIYALQYLLNIGILWGLVAVLGVSHVLAPLLVILVTVPVTYLLSRSVFLQQP